MLATQLFPAASPFSTSHQDSDGAQYRPVKDVEAFNAILPPAIQFVEGSSSGTLSIAETKYEPINSSPKGDVVPQKADKPQTQSSPSKKANAKSKELYTREINLSWPPGYTAGSGLHNIGNTCFLNSALQCLIHTPPLVRIVMQHSSPGGDTCRATGLCMICQLKQVIEQSRSRKSAFVPSPITNKLQTIAKHMRKGRQEDSHEFLRYLIDSLQKSSLAGFPPKLDHKIAETTWVHKVFGGRLRSRVTCRDCGHNSDTFDRVLDLSVDIHQAGSLRDAMKGFVNVDVLKGADKYKCEKCKKAVVAEKRFSIHEAPAVLTIHLKRFSPLGRKIGHPIKYEEHLRLQPYMSEGQHGPSYSLYGVISHAGGGPNSGHYYAHVKSPDGRWYEMNDESVTRVSNTPVGLKSAYVLFYIRSDGVGGPTPPPQVQQQQSPGNSLLSSPAIIRSPTAKSTLGAGPTLMTPRALQRPGGIVAGMKRRNEEGGEERGSKIPRMATSPPVTKKGSQIGPLLPTGAFVSGKTNAAAASAAKADPQAMALSRKISAASALQQLSLYGEPSSEADGDEAGVKSEPAKHTGGGEGEGGTDPQVPNADVDGSLAKDPAATISTSLAAPISATNFCGPKDTSATTSSDSDANSGVTVGEKGGGLGGDDDGGDNHRGGVSDLKGDGDEGEGESSWVHASQDMSGVLSNSPGKLGIRPRPAASAKQKQWKKLLGMDKRRHAHSFAKGTSPWDGKKGDNLHERRERDDGPRGSPNKSGLWRPKKRGRFGRRD